MPTNNHNKNCRIKVLLALICNLCVSSVHAQLKEFEVLPMPQPNVAVVQANSQFPDDALVLVYAAIEGLDFRSSLGALDKVSFNQSASRYELLVRPVKQMLFVAKPGYIEEKITTLNPNPKDVFYFKVEERINEALLGKGLVRINSEPQGCQIFINGLQLANKTPFTQDMPAGPNRITLKRERYFDLDTLVKVAQDKENYFELKMKPSWADLTIKTNFSDALITINGQQKGFGSVNYQGVDFGLKPDKYVINVMLDKYRPFKQSFDLRAGQIEHLTVNLEPMSGMLGVTSEPADADVIVNGRKMGVTPYKTTLPIGNYNLEVLKQGYTKQKYNLTLNDYDNKEFKAVLVNFSEALNPVKRKTKKYGLYAAIAAASAAGFYYSGIYAYQEYPKATFQAANLRRYVIASDILAPTMAALTCVALVPTIKYAFKALKLRKEFRVNR
jgi:hypothetical protein